MGFNSAFKGILWKWSIYRDTKWQTLFRLSNKEIIQTSRSRHGVLDGFVTDVSEQHIGPNFETEDVKDPWSSIIEKISRHEESITN